MCEFLLRELRSGKTLGRVEAGSSKHPLTLSILRNNRDPTGFSRESQHHTERQRGFDN